MSRTANALLLMTIIGLIACKPDTHGLATLSVSELSALRGAEADLVVCDANNAQTREKEGIIPGALLLSNYRDYEPTNELPSDTDAKLVFYCHSEQCGAAAEAARKAKAAGYTHVWLLPAGITGWASSGLPIETSSES